MLKTDYFNFDTVRLDPLFSGLTVLKLGRASAHASTMALVVSRPARHYAHL
jgi:hypothetical protein